MDRTLDTFGMNCVDFTVEVVEHPAEDKSYDKAVLLLELYANDEGALTLGFTRTGSTLMVEYSVAPDLREQEEVTQRVWGAAFDKFKTFLTEGVERVEVNGCDEEDADEVEAQLAVYFDQHIFFTNMDDE